MSTHKKIDNLSKITEKLASSFNSAADSSDTEYEFSASFTGLKTRDIFGKWKITSHQVKDESWQNVFSRATFKTIDPPPQLSYEATYEFKNGICIKKIFLAGMIQINTDEDAVQWEYRMTTVLSWDLKGTILSVHPLIGYQYTTLDGAPSSVHELPPDARCTPLEVRVENNLLYLTDRPDIKILSRME